MAKAMIVPKITFFEDWFNRLKTMEMMVVKKSWVCLGVRYGCRYFLQIVKPFRVQSSGDTRMPCVF